MAVTAHAPDDGAVRRRVLLVAILATFVAFLDGTVVTVALPAIGRELGGGSDAVLGLQQWVVDAYLVTLGSLILLAGSLSDVYGRRRVLAAGLVGFALASAACALAPTGAALVAARAVQGVAGALLVPSSLAMIVSAFDGEDQGRAIGRWTAWTGAAAIVGPLVGGVLVDTLSWRFVFWLTVPVCVMTTALLRRLPGGSRAPDRRIDARGAALAAVGLAATVSALIEAGRLGWGHPLVAGGLAVGVASLVTFLVTQARSRDPMLPLRLFSARNFAWGNAATAAIYGALGFGGFLVTLFLQQVAGYPATLAGLAQLPATFAMLGLSSRFGALAGRYGARAFMTVGPLLAAAGFLLMLVTDAGAHYWTQVLPGMLVFGLGLAVTVAPLTAAILGAVPPADAGIASGVNNAVARVAGLVVVALAGVILGGALDVGAFHRGLLVTAALFAVGGLTSLAGIRRPADGGTLGS
ncbi:MFS transporter [Xylanimonas ulmi]|uniref:EmrB/QacA subfamily drug resistance transporter n=1 Tax=Xylanimonas ulmi TaxID=228973 RepID=A0A4Q7LZJ6_9MICO|nr:MFS transporter [Xylanibacterium ulmi]RZS60231.1 EmrB/QacA subfamily drug resistance transporter [Xylanibacterium ulmi]